MVRLLVLLLLSGLWWPLAAHADDPLAELASGNFNTRAPGCRGSGGVRQSPGRDHHFRAAGWAAVLHARTERC